MLKAIIVVCVLIGMGAALVVAPSIPAFAATAVIAAGVLDDQRFFDL